MKYFIKILVITTLSFFFWQVAAQNYEISSPDRNIKVYVNAGKSILYSVKYKDKLLILPSPISLSIQSGSKTGSNADVTDTVTRFINKIIIPVVKEKRAIIPDVCNELILRLTNHLELQFRVYEDAIAYRFTYSQPDDLIILDEEANFIFPKGTLIYYPQVRKRSNADIFHTSFEENYSKAGLDTLPDNMFAFSPVLIQPADLPKVLITESDIKDYPGMFVVRGNKSGIKGRYAPFSLKETPAGGGFRQSLVTERASYLCKTKGPRTFPWRIIAIAPTDASLLTNDIVYRLAPEADFSDFSWIKPGKSTEEWITGLNLYGVDFEAGINTETYKYYIDFAARFGFEYVMLDAGWSDVNDLFKITPGMNMEEITGYAKQKGIGLILWTQALTIEKQLDQALQQFKKWDIKIVMTDFIDRNDQVAINFLHRFAAECSRYKFMCMIHGAPIPAGFSRTYPNMVAREGVLGSEYNAWSSKANPDHDLMIPFIRMFSGPMDYEPGILQNATKKQAVKMGFEKVIAQGTIMHQIAMFVVYESPLQLFSGNLSDAIRKPELMDFLGKIPTVWDETKVIDAKLGEYIVETRRNGDNWYVAAMNSWTPVEFSIPLKFLSEGNYMCEIASDGINAARNPEDFKILRSEVTSKDSLTLKLKPGGGFVARISKNKF
jgi:alpha-glucosidase